MNVKGVKDLVENSRFSLSKVQQELINHDVPGNWLSTQNVYNLINGRIVPRDAYVYIFLSDFLSEDIKKILGRYSKKQTSYAMIDSDIF